MGSKLTLDVEREAAFWSIAKRRLGGAADSNPRQKQHLIEGPSER